MSDVVVIGGGPAGLATAIAAAQRGLSAVVVEARRPPIDKACGEGLMPSGVRALEDLGINPSELAAQPFAGIRYLDFCDDGRPIVAEGRFDSEPGLGIRRTVLHDALRTRAERLGVTLQWETRATGLAPHTVLTRRGELAAGVIVGADGLHSRVRGWGGFKARPGKHARFGVTRHYRIRPWSELVEVWFDDGAEAYVTPLDREQVGVALLFAKQENEETSAGPANREIAVPPDRRGAAPRFDEQLQEFPELADRLGQAEVLGEDRGAGSFHRIVTTVARGHLALVGDAAGFLDPITGEGVGLALRQAHALARHIEAGTLPAYGRELRRIGASHAWLTRLLLLLVRRPPWRLRAITSLAVTPGLFTTILSAQRADSLARGRRARPGPLHGRVSAWLNQERGSVAPGVVVILSALVFRSSAIYRRRLRELDKRPISWWRRSRRDAAVRSAR